jgi:hypothetical protein
LRPRSQGDLLIDGDAGTNHRTGWNPNILRVHHAQAGSNLAFGRDVDTFVGSPWHGHDAMEDVDRQFEREKSAGFAPMAEPVGEGDPKPWVKRPGQRMRVGMACVAFGIGSNRFEHNKDGTNEYSWFMK